MYEAYLIVNENEKKLVSANEVTHSDYSRIFQCFECGSTLTLRQGHWRNEHWVNPTFVHPERNPDDCRFRSASDAYSSTNDSVFDLISRGQSSSKLEQAFLKFIKHGFWRDISIWHKTGGFAFGVGKLGSVRSETHLRRKLRYNEIPGITYSEPSLLIDAASAILESKKCERYFYQRIEEFQRELRQYDQEFQRKPEFFIYRANRLTTIEILIDNHCQCLQGIARFVSQGISNKCRENLLRVLIWGDQSLVVSVEHLWNQSEIIYARSRGNQENTSEIEQQRSSKVEKIQGFSPQVLDKICKSPQFLDQAFRDFYQGKASTQVDFIEFVLSMIINTIRDYDWDLLPKFYAPK